MGICFGATSMQCVILQSDSELRTILLEKRLNHEGNPRGVFQTFLDTIDLFEIDRIAVTGRGFRKSVALSSISEPEAVEEALRVLFEGKSFPDVVVSSGGETQLVYKIAKQGGIESVHSGNKCASGTGEFFLQQIRRMGLSIEKAIKLAQNEEPYKIAGRCSVFCKSDCTHAMNKSMPIKNIVAGLCSMMADKVDDLLKDMSDDSIVIIGGGSMNTAMVDILKKRHSEVIIPEFATTFEAYGAALWAIDHPCIILPENIEKLFVNNENSLSYHPSLAMSDHYVDFKKSEKNTAQDGDVCILGLDVGSTTTKAVLIRKSDKKIISDIYLRTNGNPVNAAKECYKVLYKDTRNKNISIIGLGVTGSGRQIAGLHALTDNVINEIIAHATAAAHYDPEVDTIFEIGGQDAKYTYLTGGVPSDYAMNEACSAGTGSFLEESAFETLGVKTEDISNYALKATSPPNFSDQCAAFISSDIKNAAQVGVSKKDILAGLVYSICMNYVNRVKGSRSIGKKIFMQGGVCYNKAVPIAMATLLKTPIVVPPDPGLIGALGVALETLKRIELSLTKEVSFDLSQLINRETETVGTFICAGGKEKCDRKCEISRISVSGKIYAFGGMCDKYYNQRINRDVRDIEDLDLVAMREDLMFGVYGPNEPTTRNDYGHQPRTVGLNKSLLLYSLYPLFSNFFSRLGLKVVLSDGIDNEGVSRTEAAFCLPAEVSHGSFYNLLKKKCDYIFMPQVMQIPIPNVPTFSRLCPFVQGEPYYLKTTFRNEIDESGSILLSPVLKMENGYDSVRDIFVSIAVKMGNSEKNARNAYAYACEKQLAFERELQKLGKKLLYHLEKNPDKFGIVLFGRPYNAFSKDINMGIPHKVASRGYSIIPLDMIPTERFPVDKKMFWAMGQKIMKAAQYVQEQENLFGFYITNFSCGPDSFIINYFREVMGSKPSLTLELDQHTADAGIDTRIEAALDIIVRYKQVKDLFVSNMDNYIPAKVKFPYVYSSTGKKFHVTDKQVEVLIPSFGHRSSQAVAAILRKMGIDARALPVLDKDGLILGRKNTSGKECLPYIINMGAFLSYIEKKRDSEKITCFVMATGGGPCRLGQYFRSYEQVLWKKKIQNVAMLTITDEDGYGGLGSEVVLKSWQGIVLTDILSDIESQLRVNAKDPEYAMQQFDNLWKKCISYFEGKLSIRFTSLLKFISMHLSRIPLKKDVRDVPVISLVGEIFVRRDEFSRKNIVSYLEDCGFMVRVAPLAEYVCYGNYVVNKGLGEKKFSFQEHLKMKLVSRIQDWWEKYIKTILGHSGLYKPEMIEVDKTINGVNHLLNENFRGECILTVGLSMREILNNSCGIISIGPFGCMYSRMAESMLKKEMNYDGIKRMPDGKAKLDNYNNRDSFPFLSIETDGNPFPQLVEANLESFVLQVRRVHEQLMKAKGRKIIVDVESIDSLVEKQ